MSSGEGWKVSWKSRRSCTWEGFLEEGEACRLEGFLEVVRLKLGKASWRRR